LILIIQIHSIPFHYFEFVKPIEDVIKRSGLPFSSIHYKDLSKHHLENARKIIIAGTSLKDHSYLNDKEKFKWIESFKNPILGICGGMQLLAASFNEKIRRGQEIGLHTICYNNDFLGDTGQKEVYELHNNYVEPEYFQVIATSKQYPQAIKHPECPFYGVLFHPEVRNKQLITYFDESL